MGYEKWTPSLNHEDDAFARKMETKLRSSSEKSQLEALALLEGRLKEMGVSWHKAVQNILRETYSSNDLIGVADAYAVRGTHYDGVELRALLLSLKEHRHKLREDEESFVLSLLAPAYEAGKYSYPQAKRAIIIAKRAGFDLAAFRKGEIPPPPPKRKKMAPHPEERCTNYGQAASRLAVGLRSIIYANGRPSIVFTPEFIDPSSQEKVVCGYRVTVYSDRGCCGHVVKTRDFVHYKLGREYWKAWNRHEESGCFFIDRESDVLGVFAP